MTRVSRSGRRNWQLIAAVVLSFALVLGLGTVFRLAGLGAAANVVQILSVLPLSSSGLRTSESQPSQILVPW
jgi:hypothetical protein